MNPFTWNTTLPTPSGHPIHVHGVEGFIFDGKTEEASKLPSYSGITGSNQFLSPYPHCSVLFSHVVWHAQYPKISPQTTRQPKNKLFLISDCGVSIYGNPLTTTKTPLNTPVIKQLVKWWIFAMIIIGFSSRLTTLLLWWSCWVTYLFFGQFWFSMEHHERVRTMLAS